MKPPSLIRAALMFLTLGLACVVFASASPAQDEESGSLAVYAANIEIVSATWGTGDIFIDVTARERRMFDAPEQT